MPDTVDVLNCLINIVEWIGWKLQTGVTQWIAEKSAMTRLSIGLCILVLSVYSQAQAASFSCDRASLKAEKPFVSDVH